MFIVKLIFDLSFLFFFFPPGVFKAHFLWGLFVGHHHHLRLSPLLLNKQSHLLTPAYWLP